MPEVLQKNTLVSTSSTNHNPNTSKKGEAPRPSLFFAFYMDHSGSVDKYWGLKQKHKKQLAFGEKQNPVGT
ncbi:MAG: hypothetical protein L6U16_08720 [Porphyromonadaceae bacterium]|nr:MAG: hypothetical protein L6U16_08720 [Porphyromonadaceae bacterium]